MGEYRCNVEIGLEAWNKASKENKLAELVESAAYQAISEALRAGKVGVFRDVRLNIVPNFSEDKTHEVVEVVVLYDTIL